MQTGNFIPVVTIVNCYRGPFSIELFGCSESDGGVSGCRGRMECDEAADRDGQGLAREESSRFPLVKFFLIFKPIVGQYKNCSF